MTGHDWDERSQDLPAVMYARCSRCGAYRWGDESLPPLSYNEPSTWRDALTCDEELARETMES